VNPTSFGAEKHVMRNAQFDELVHDYAEDERKGTGHFRRVKTLADGGEDKALPHLAV